MRLELVLLAATAASVYLSGLQLYGPVGGAVFTAGLLGGLLAHEAGHLYAARRLMYSVRGPFLIPAPMTPIGTLGAVMFVEEVEDPAHEAAIALAGPLLGLLVAVFELALGARLAQPVPGPVEGPAVTNWLLILFGGLLGVEGPVEAGPLLMAGWALCTVTFLNLIPIPPLDGGRVARSCLPPLGLLVVAGWSTAMMAASRQLPGLLMAGVAAALAALEGRWEWSYDVRLLPLLGLVGLIAALTAPITVG